MSQGNPRRVRVAQSIRDVLAEMLDREVSDPRVKHAGLATIGHVELNRDMSVARVYISFMGPAEHDARARDRAAAGLARVATFLRGKVGRRLRLRYAPELRFVIDDSPAFSQRLTELVRDDASEPSGEDLDTAESDGAGEA